MARKCNVCSHSKRTEIDGALVRNENLRNISIQYKISESSLFRHRRDHLPATLAKAKAARESKRDLKQADVVLQEVEAKQERDQAHAETVWAGLSRCIDRVNMLFDACHEYLQDTDNPTRYDIGPRSEDVLVTYMEPTGEDGKEVRRKRKLSELLVDIEERGGVAVKHTTIRHADIRELILKTMSEARSNLGFLVDLEVLDHNERERRLFAEELFNFLDELEPGLRERFLDRLRDKRMMRSAFTLETRRSSDD